MSRFTEQDDIVTDSKTGLEWQQAGSTEQMDWQAAIKYCENLGDGWRLPTVQELLSIVDYERYHPAIYYAFDCKASGHWSASYYAGFANHEWGVNFYSGNSYTSSRRDSHYALAVRTGVSK